ncbi:unnamed protein product, partial [Leptidea sinapis]
SHKSLVSF